MDSILFEAILFGVVNIILVLIYSIAFSFLKPELPKQCEEWDKNLIMESISFAVGFTFYLLLKTQMVRQYYPNLFK